MSAMDPCPFQKSGRHELMAIIPEAIVPEHPLTLACTHCGMSQQYALTWAPSETLDNRTADEILAAVNQKDA